MQKRREGFSPHVPSIAPPCFGAFLFSIVLFSSSTLAKVPLEGRSLKSCEAFTSVEEIALFFSSVERDHVDLARAFIVGKSFEGRDIHGLKLSAFPDEEATEPEIRILGGIHGDECISVELVLEFTDYLVQKYGEDPFVTELLDNAEIQLIPSLNPDGYSSARAYRYNARGVDLNRNFHFAWVNGGSNPFSEPETQAFRNFSQNSNFVMSLSYHTIETYVNSTWNYTPYHPPDEELFAAIGAAYAGTSGYDVTFGWDWYGIYGDVDDWSLGTSGTFAWTIELRNDEEMEFPVHLAGLQGFLQFAGNGIRGQVNDADTGEPLPARIDVEPHGAPVYTDRDVGDYHRILLPGSYDLTAHCPGYVSETIEEVVAPQEGYLVVNFELERKEEEILDFAFAINGMTLPKEIDDSFSKKTYLNDTMVWDALGEPDGHVYSLSPGGTLTLDMGEKGIVRDVKGTDLIIVSGSVSEDPVRVLVAQSQDGPFVEVAGGDGHIDVDIARGGFNEIRFVRLVDTGEGRFESAYAGYDLDGVVNVTRGSYTPPVDEDETDSDSGDCGCAAFGQRSRSSVFKMLSLL